MDSTARGPDSPQQQSGTEPTEYSEATLQVLRPIKTAIERVQGSDPITDLGADTTDALAIMAEAIAGILGRLDNIDARQDRAT